MANRGHHADIGGITPGSMPPHSKSIFEEGAVFKSFFLVKNGTFQEEGQLLSIAVSVLPWFLLVAVGSSLSSTMYVCISYVHARTLCILRTLRYLQF